MASWPIPALAAEAAIELAMVRISDSVATDLAPSSATCEAKFMYLWPLWSASTPALSTISKKRPKASVALSMLVPVMVVNPATAWVKSPSLSALMPIWAPSEPI